MPDNTVNFHQSVFSTNVCHNFRYFCTEYPLQTFYFCTSRTIYKFYWCFSTKIFICNTPCSKEHLFYWPGNSFCHANPSVLQAKQITSSKSNFIIFLSKLLNLSCYLDVCTVLPFWIWRPLLSQCSPVVVYTQKNTNCLQRLLSDPSPHWRNSTSRVDKLK